jgi:hypothetical protein
MESVQQQIHNDVLNTVHLAIADLGYSIPESPELAGDATAIIIYDEFSQQAWPPPHPGEGDVDLAPVTLILQPGRETIEDTKISNADLYTQEFNLGFTLAGDPGRSKDPTDGQQTLQQRARSMKDHIIKTLRTDRYRGNLADDTREFSAAAWSWPDGSACGYSITFSIRWRTNANDPLTSG